MKLMICAIFNIFFQDLNTLKESQERSDMRYVTTLHIGYNPETLVNSWFLRFFIFGIKFTNY